MTAFIPLDPLPTSQKLSTLGHAKRWWKRLTPHRQDRVAVMAPLVAVLLFLAAIVATLGYLRIEESNREQEAVQHDVEYTQQRLRLLLMERQEQLSRLAREVSNFELDNSQFKTRAKALLLEFPELHSVSWVDENRRTRTGVGTVRSTTSYSRETHENLKEGDTQTASGFIQARELNQPVYVQNVWVKNTPPVLQLSIPLSDRGRFSGVLMAEYSVDALFRYGVPSEVAARYAVSLLDSNGALLAGMAIAPKKIPQQFMPWASAPNEYYMPVSPVGMGMVLRAQAYRSSLSVIGSGLFWLVTALSLLTVWMLVANWRHTRRRLETQQELMNETSFRRAMESSMLTGMRAMDLHGRITYVNTAFCQMTGWAESDLVGRTAPFVYWPEADREQLMLRQEEELAGKTTATGVQVRVQRRDKSLFEARLYVSPLIDSMGKHTGWMTSMTDITEPNRVREQLSASHQRFTTVLEALDASISVTPLGGSELLFANKLYRQWFGTQGTGHLQLVAQAGVQPSPANDEAKDSHVDSFAGLPTSTLPETDTESTQIFVTSLNKWLEVRARYLSWVDGRLAQMVIATDITARRLSEEQSATQFERAQTASRLITMGEMASSVAHELNQPLTAINNYCNGMVSRIKTQQISAEDLLDVLEKTARQAHRAGQIIQRIRSFVKRSEPNRTRAEVDQMVAEAVELAELELRRFNVRLNHYVAARLPVLLVDPILIEQVLVNLLRNAAEAIDMAHRQTSQRVVELRVVPRRVDDKPVVEFSVQDTGMGLAPEVMARLYETFYSTKADGMGIGLSLCRSIVESHLGRMSAENLYNGSEVTGCKFSFWLPLSIH